MKSKTLIAAFFAALSINAMANPPNIPTKLTNGTPGYTQGFTASGNCAVDWDNRSGYGAEINTCEPIHFFVSLSDDYVGGPFSIGNHHGGTFGLAFDDSLAWWTQSANDEWYASGSIGGGLWFMNSGAAVHAPYIARPNSGEYWDQDWAWALFAENGVGGQTWFGDSFTWNTTVMARVATVASDVAEPEVLALFALGLLLIGGRKWAGKGIWNFVVHLRNGKKLFQPSTGLSTI